LIVAVDGRPGRTDTPDDESARNGELGLALRILAEDLPNVRENLHKLAGVLGGSIDEQTTEIFARLETIAATTDYQEFHAVAGENYVTPELFKATYELCERGKRLTARYPELHTMKSDRDGLAAFGEPKVDLDAMNLLTQLNFNEHWMKESRLASLQDLFWRFKAKYSLGYRKAHRTYHESLEQLHNDLIRLDNQLTVIERLNGLDLGVPVGGKLGQEVETLKWTPNTGPLGMYN
jgi:hypothetical protein